MYTLMDPEMWDMFVSRDVCQWQKFYLSFLIILAVAFPTELHLLQHHIHCINSNTSSKHLLWKIAYDSMSIAHMTSENRYITADSPYVREEIESYNQRKDLIKRYNNIMHDVWPFLDLIASLGNSTLDRKDFNQGFKTGYYVGGVLAFVGIITGITGIILRCKPKALRSCIEGRTSGHAEMVHGRETRNEELKQLDESPEVLNENMFDPLNPESAYLTIEDVPTIGVTSSVSLGQSASTTVE
ncbi:uncharacterized protein LOC122811579 isoform X3 [Protopterus annectens]|uniref:uncharacterized protein LOC122811579 isoform X3 n=1 Tax=Protopterus annectens TaxID=7888 RepID=UPI001CFAD6D5|nr:uncharacterized protein LOC122811579 isoform X3 [Protopterus annectens]